MHCAHCMKTISRQESHKALADLLSLPNSSDSDLGQPEVTVLNALACVVGIRLLIKDKLVLPENLCICSSCEQLLQYLFLAHECFTNENSFIVKKYDWNGESRVPMYVDTSTQTDFANAVQTQSANFAPDQLDDDNNDMAYYDNGDFQIDEPGSPEPVTIVDNEQISIESICTRLGIQDISRFPFIEIEPSLRKLADLKLKEIQEFSLPSVPEPNPVAYSRIGIAESVRGREVKCQEEEMKQLFLAGCSGKSSTSFRLRRQPQTNQVRRSKLTSSKQKNPTGAKVTEDVRFFNRWYDSMSLPNMIDNPSSRTATTLPQVEESNTHQISPGHDNSPMASAIKKSSCRTPSKKHVCNEVGCRKSFRTFYHLRRHLRSHNKITDCSKRLPQTLPDDSAADKASSKTIRCNSPGCVDKSWTAKGLLSHKISKQRIPEEMMPEMMGAIQESRVNSEGTEGDSNIDNIECKINLEQDSIPITSAIKLPSRLRATTSEYECVEQGCNKAFLTPYDLKRHLLTHKNIRMADGSGADSPIYQMAKPGMSAADPDAADANTTLGNQESLSKSDVIEETEAKNNESSPQYHSLTLRRRTQINYNEVDVDADKFDDDDEDFTPENSIEPEDDEEDCTGNTTIEGQGQQVSRIKNIGQAKNAQEYHCKFPDCNDKLFTLNGLTDHEIQKHGRPKMDPEVLTVKRRDPARNKSKTHYCSLDGCGKSFKRSSDLKRHRETHLPKEERRQRPPGKLKCDELYCGRIFRKNRDFLRHRNTHLPPELKLVFPRKEKTFKCEEAGCTLTFHTLLKLERHKNSHLPLELKSRTFPCLVCKKMFASPRTRDKHTKSTHAEGLNYLCTVCGKAFKANLHLNNHMIIHKNERSYKCKICGKGFNRPSTLKAHSTVHTGERSIVCEICGKGFKNRLNLTYHMAQHDNKRQHKCPAPSCTADFNYKHHLRQHLEGVHSLDPQKVNRFLKNPESEKLFD